MSFNIGGLPSELIILILKNLPPTTLQESRLVSHKLNYLAFPIVFSHVPSWLNSRKSRHRLIAISVKEERPSTMWSPLASEPEKDLDEIWLCIVYKMLSTKNPPVLILDKMVEANESEFHRAHKDPEDQKDDDKFHEEETNEGDREETTKLLLTPDNLAKLIGREELTPQKLKNAQNRYRIHRAYTNRVIPKGSVVRRKIWAYCPRVNADGTVELVESNYYGSYGVGNYLRG